MSKRKPQKARGEKWVLDRKGHIAHKSKAARNTLKSPALMYTTGFPPIIQILSLMQPRLECSKTCNGFRVPPDVSSSAEKGPEPAPTAPWCKNCWDVASSAEVQSSCSWEMDNQAQAQASGCEEKSSTTYLSEWRLFRWRNPLYFSFSSFHWFR